MPCGGGGRDGASGRLPLPGKGGLFVNPFIGKEGADLPGSPFITKGGIDLSGDPFGPKGKRPPGRLPFSLEGRVGRISGPKKRSLV